VPTTNITFSGSLALVEEAVGLKAPTKILSLERSGNHEYNIAMAITPIITEAEILEDIVSPREASLTPDAARIFLEMKFSKDATKRIRQLLQKNNRGTITPEERATLEKYLRVGQFLDLLQAKAKLSLRGESDAQ
jgi:hypothetical protein